MILFVLFVFWILCGIVAAVVASNKGRNVFGWLVLGFLLGPIGMILSLVVSKNQATVEQQAIESGGMRKCPFCAELIRAEAVKCRFCSSEVPKQEVTAPTRLERTHCPSCGKAIRPSPEDMKCMWCEADLAPPGTH